MKITGEELFQQLGEIISPVAPDPRFRLIPGRNEFICLADSHEELARIHADAVAKNLDLGYFVLPLDMENANVRVKPPEGTEIYFPIFPHENAVAILTDIADQDDIGASLHLDADEASGALLAHAIGLNLPIRIVTDSDPAAILIAIARMETEDLSPREWVKEVLNPVVFELEELIAEELTDWVTSIARGDD